MTVRNPFAKLYAVKTSTVMFLVPSPLANANQDGLVPTVQSNYAKRTVLAMASVKTETVYVIMGMEEKAVLSKSVRKSAAIMEFVRMEFVNVSRDF